MLAPKGNRTLICGRTKCYLVLENRIVWLECFCTLSFCLLVEMPMCLPVYECMNLVKRCRIQSCWMFQIPPDVQALFDDPCCTELNSEVCIALLLANGRT